MNEIKQGCSRMQACFADQGNSNWMHGDVNVTFVAAIHGVAMTAAASPDGKNP